MCRCIRLSAGICAFRGQQEGVPVHLSSVWTGDFSTGVHQAAATRRVAVKAARCEATRLLRRLADQGRYSGTSSTACPDNHQSAPVSWLDHQLREVRPHITPSQDFQFIGMQFNTQRFTVAPLPKMRLKVHSVHQHWMANPNITARDLHRLLGMLVFMASLVRRGRLRLRSVQWWAATAWCQRTGNWSDRIQVSQWVLSEVAWWSSPAVLQGLPLVTKETEVTLFTDASSSGWGAQLGSRSTQGQWSASRQQGDYIGFRPSARNAQHPGGFPVQSRPDTDHGVDDGHEESTTRVCQVGRATDQLVCDIRQQTTRQVRIAVSGPQGGVDRCHVHALGQGEGPSVRLPVIQDGPSSTAGVEVILIAQLQPAASWFPESMDLSQDSSKVKTYWHKTFGWETVKSTCVETLRAILRAKGHSREAANMMSRCLRKSSQQVYESHWSRFVAFCRTKRWHVFRVRSHHFSSYMMHLFRDGLLPSMIISHRTSVASVLRHWVYDPAADPHIKLLVRAFRLECPVQRRIMPKWDLHLVLLSLLRPPFTSQSEEDGESLDDVIPLKWQTLKCVFLLALASARRRSYSAWQMCVPERKHSTTTCGISTSGTWLLGEESAADAGPWMDHGTWDCPLESDGTGENAMSCETVSGTLKESGGAVSACSYTGTAASGISWGAT